MQMSCPGDWRTGRGSGPKKSVIRVTFSDRLGHNS